MTEPAAARRNMRILIVAHAFPPMNSTASHRPYSWAKTWVDMGHEVHVLTPVKHPFDGAMDMERDLSGIQVHHVPYLPLAPSRSGSGEEKRVARWEWLKTVTRRVRFSIGLFGDLRLLSYVPMVRRGKEVLRDARFDFIIATAPPEGILAVAKTLSRRAGLPWVADFRDLWFHDMLLYRSALLSRMLGPINRRLASSAGVLVTVSSGLQQRLSQYLHREVLLSYNGFFEDDFSAAPARRPPGGDRVHLVYTGRVYPEKRDPGPLFRAVAEIRKTTPDLANRLAVDFYGFDEPWLRALIAEHGVEDCVSLHGFVPYRESVAAQRGADMLLFLDWMALSAEGVLTGKLFEYLASGRPILSIGARKDSEAARILADAGCGITLTRHEEIVSYLRSLLEDRRPPDTDASRVGAFSRERQARRLLGELTARLTAAGERDG
jgi:glycosyltransferase involved in cell wall biosynthesis